MVRTQSLVVLMCVASALSVKYTYTSNDNQVSPEWFEPGNWDPNGIPGEDDDVVIDFSMAQRGQLFIQTKKGHEGVIRAHDVNISGYAGGEVHFLNAVQFNNINIESNVPTVYFTTAETILFSQMNLIQTTADSFQFQTALLQGQINVYAGAVLHFGGAGDVMCKSPIYNNGDFVIDNDGGGIRPVYFLYDVDNTHGSLAFTGRTIVSAAPGKIKGGVWAIGPTAEVTFNSGLHTPTKVEIQGSLDFQGAAACNLTANLHIGEIDLQNPDAKFNCSCSALYVKHFTGGPGYIYSQGGCGLTIEESASLPHLWVTEAGKSITFNKATSISDLTILANTIIVANVKDEDLTVDAVNLKQAVTWRGSIYVNTLDMAGQAAWTISDGSKFYVKTRWKQSSVTGNNMEMQGTSDLYLNGTVVIDQSIVIAGHSRYSNTIHNDGRIIVDLPTVGPANASRVLMTDLALLGKGFAEIAAGRMYLSQCRVNQTAVQLQSNKSYLIGANSELSLEDVVAKDDSQHIQLNISQMTLQCHRACGKVTGTASFEFVCVDEPYDDKLPPTFAPPSASPADGGKSSPSGGSTNTWIGWVVGIVIGVVAGALLTGIAAFIIVKASGRRGYTDIQGKTP